MYIEKLFNINNVIYANFKNYLFHIGYTINEINNMPGEKLAYLYIEKYKLKEKI